MVGFTIKKRFEAPPERVFEVCTDLRNAARHINGIKKLEVLGDGPIGVGTRFRETRVMFKRECTEEMTITQFEPNKSYSLGATNCGCEYQTTFEFHPTGTSTRVDVTFKSIPKTLFAKLMSPLGRLLCGTMKKMFDRDMEDLKAYAERN